MHLDTHSVRHIAERHGFDETAGQAMVVALVAGGGNMAQFSHPALGGMGQWSRGGMLMIGELFNDQLKGRVRSLAEDLAQAMHDEGSRGSEPAGHDAEERHSSSSRMVSSGEWWPSDLGRPGASGAQNGMRYTVFPKKRCLAIEKGGRIEIHDTGDHHIGGASQQQGSGSTLQFTSQHGIVDLEALPRLP